MTQESVMVRNVDRIATFIQKYVNRVGIDRREEVFELLDNMNLLFPQWVIMSCPMMHPEMHFVSKNGPSVFGYDPDYLKTNSSAKQMLAHLHDADREDVLQCFTIAHDQLASLTPEEHTQYRFVLYYRYRKGDGRYMHLHDEKAAMNLRGSGNLYYGLFRDLSDERPFTGVKLEIFRQQEQGLVKIREFRPASTNNPLSKREGELVTLMKRGLSTKEIASHLNISHNTVRNIKSKLFEKYNVNNSIELLNMTG
jgi:DNA-binding CsgD family transcriptional regulator